MKIITGLFAILVFCLPGHTCVNAQQLNSNADLKCGSYCLYVALNALNLSVEDFETLETTLGQPTALGYSIQQLCDATTKLNAFPLAVQTSLDLLEHRKGRFACIALLEKTGHYVCIYDIDADSVFIVDPPNKRIIPRDTFLTLWNGKGILVSDKPLVPQSQYRFSSARYLLFFSVILFAIFMIRKVFLSKRRGK